MATVRPFAGIHYAARADLPLSQLIAPPYDVLNQQDKDRLQSRHAHNIISVDLPFLPPKSVGPDAVYEQSARTLSDWLAQGILVRDPQPALYPYTQTYQHAGQTYRRRGLIGLVRLSAFGRGEVVPHEKTYQGPIEDRLKLMRYTGVQLSPIFGLFSDPDTRLTDRIYQNLGAPMLAGSLDGVENQLWSITDPAAVQSVAESMRPRPVYIADGHHRYTTALAYQRELQQQAGGNLPEDHPANWCMFVLVAMQDPGLLILPTHRLIGGLQNFRLDDLRAALADSFDLTPLPTPARQIEPLAERLGREAPHTFGLYDGTTGQSYLLKLKKPDLLANLEPAQSPAWRQLDVAILQRYLLDEILTPRFAKGGELTRGYTADARTIPADVDGQQYQLALLLQPTPLSALEDLGRSNEVMPQKSTYFFPKLATGMVLHPLR